MTNDKITIIGIAGGTGSGKTTVVKKIVEALPPHHVAVVPLDSYYNDTSHMTEEERRAINFDHPDAFDWKLLIKQINDLREGRAIEQPTYSYLKCNDRGRTVSMVVDRYLKVLKPMHEQFIEPTKRFAHIIIPEGGDNLKGINMVCKYIESIVEK